MKKNAKGKAQALNNVTMSRKAGLKSNKKGRSGKGLSPSSGRAWGYTKDTGSAPNKIGM